MRGQYARVSVWAMAFACSPSILLAQGPAAAVVIMDFDAGADGRVESRTTTVSTRDQFGNVSREFQEFDALADGIVDSRTTTTRVYASPGTLLQELTETDDHLDGTVDRMQAEEWSYDAQGRAARRSRLTRGFSFSRSLTTYDYDADGRLAIEDEVIDEGIEDNGIDRRTRTAYAYDALGRIAARHVVRSNPGFPFSIRSTQTEVYGVPTDSIQTRSVFDLNDDGLPDGLFQTDRHYDAAGVLLELEAGVTDLNGDGAPELLSRTTFTHDDAGRLLERVHSMGNAAGELQWVDTERNEYDGTGALVRSVAERDSDGDGDIDERTARRYFTIGTP